MISPPSQFGIIIPQERDNAQKGIKKTGKRKGKKKRETENPGQAGKEGSSGNGYHPSLYSNNFSSATIIVSPIL